MALTYLGYLADNSYSSKKCINFSCRSDWRDMKGLGQKKYPFCNPNINLYIYVLLPTLTLDDVLYC